METNEDDGISTRVQSLSVTVRGGQVQISINTPSEDEALDLAQVLVFHFKEYGAATIEILEKGATLQ